MLSNYDPGTINFKWIRKLAAYIILPWLFVFSGMMDIYSQSNLKFDRLTSENSITVKGLSQNTIYCLLQDSKGYIWLGTWDGLNKYDGYDFVIYNTSNGLSNPTINSIYEDDQGNIWIGTDHGLNILQRENGNLKQLFHAPDNSNSLSDNFITHIVDDRNGFIWISTAYGLNRFDKEKQIFNSFNFFERSGDSALTNYVTRVREDSSSLIWIATHRGLHCYDPQKQTFRDYKMEEDVNSPVFTKSNYIQDFAIDAGGRIYVATLNGLFLVQPGGGINHHLKVENQGRMGLSSNQVNAVLIDSKGLVWIGTSNGLDIYDPVNESIASYKAGVKITNLSNEDIRSIFQDQAGTMWIGTYKGLNKVDPSPSRFLHFHSDPDNSNSLAENIVYAILEVEENIVWIGTFAGVDIFDRKLEKFTSLKYKEHTPESLSSKKVRTLVLDSAGYVWIGTENCGLCKVDLKTGKITSLKHINNDSTTISEDNIMSSYVDSKGRIWVGTVNKGVNIIDPENGKIQFLSTSLLSKALLSDNKIWNIYEDREGNMWLGTNSGLDKISPDLRLLERFKHDPTNENSISSDRIFSIYQDTEGIFWIGTMGGGLNRYDPEKQQFEIYSDKNGLANNVVYGTLDDGQGNLWMSTNWGLSRFNKEMETFVNYDTKDGVQGNEFNVGAYFKNRNGEMYFGGMNGFNLFHPSEIAINKIPPRMTFTGFRVLNVLQDTDIEDGELIRLNYNENFFSIEFSALDYTNPAKNNYRYKLNNYDDEWNYANSGHRRAEYRKVDPGTYKFVVTGSNNDGVWNEQGISLTIIIRPPWWMTWLFRTSVVVISILLMWSIILLRIKSIRRKHELDKKLLTVEKQIFELEQKALRLQMNPHFMFNSLNAIQNFVLANDTDRAVNYLAKFSHLMRMVLANSTASLITLKDELKALTYYIDLEQLRFDNKFDYEIIRDPKIDEEFVEIPPLLFQPYVENAIIHGLVNSPKHGKIEIHIKHAAKGTLLCSIKDNGIGREKAIAIRNESGIKRQPKGMVITQERIEIFNKQNNRNFSVRITDLKDDHGEPAGTKVEFTIQYKEN
jgi:ligand-binding sensor domain-containing protein